MKFNTLFVAAICAGSLMTSCVNDTANQNQLKYTHTSLVDGDAFAYIQTIGETALDGVKYAEYAEKAGDSKSVGIASQVKSFYTQMLPSLDSLATISQMDFPIKGIPQGHDEADSTSTADSTAHAAHSHFDYVQHAQHEIAVIKDKLKRMTRNTNVDVQKFGKKQLELATDLYTQIGGKEEAHGHH